VVEQPVQVQPVAPAIFAASGQAMATNADNSPNSALNPATRGQALNVYATGLGTSHLQGSTVVLDTPLSVVFQGFETNPSKIAPAKDLPGVYVVTVTVPVDVPPGLAATLGLRQAGIDGNQVQVAIQ